MSTDKPNVARLLAQVAAVAALANKWAEEIARGHAQNPDGHPALTGHERDLIELRAALDQATGGEG